MPALQSPIPEEAEAIVGLFPSWEIGCEVE